MDWKKIVSVAIGLAIFLVLLMNANLNRTLGIFANINLFWFFCALSADAIGLSLKTFKWKMLLGSGKKIGFAEAFRYYLIGFFFSAITPGRIGDFVRAKYAGKKTGLAYATTSVLLDRLIDVALLLAIGFVAVIVAAELFGLAFFSPEIILFLLAGLIGGIYFASKKNVAYFFLKPIHKKIVPEKFRQKTREAFHGIYDAIEIFKGDKMLLAKATATGVLIWGITITSVYFLSLSINLGLPFYAFFMIVPLMALSDLIPLSVGGLGPREFITINALAVFLIGYDEAIAFSILYFFSGYLLISIIGGFAFLNENMRAKNNAK